MSLADLFAQEKRKTGPSCTVGLFLDAMKDKADRATLEAELARSTSERSSTEICRVLSAAGFETPPPVGAVRRHRSGECACHR